MYEGITFQLILRRMIDRVLEKDPNLDTREGSIIYNALAPAAVGLQNMYIQLDTVLNETFADTATRYYLVKRAAERGIIPYPATNAILQGVFNIDIPIGSRFSLEDLNYAVVEKISDGIFKLQCETAGTIGNQYFGRLVPIDYIYGLTAADLTELLIPGEDEETTEHFRQRYYESLNAEAFGGNIKDYREKVEAISGVGGVKVYPVWNGGGTVRLVIIASDYSVPTETLVKDVQARIDPVTNHGAGAGLAPIGHVVTVEAVASFKIDIETSITYQDGWTWEDVKPYAEQAADDYFSELASTWDNTENLIIRISQIEMRFLNLPGVIDITGTALNGEAKNLTLGEDVIPVRGNLFSPLGEKTAEASHIPLESNFADAKSDQISFLDCQKRNEKASEMLPAPADGGKIDG